MNEIPGSNRPYSTNSIPITTLPFFPSQAMEQNPLSDWAVREITKSSSTFSATNISSNIVCLLQLHDTIQMKFNFGTKFSSIYLAKGEKHLVFLLSFVNLQRAKNGTHMFDAKYRYVFAA